MNNYTIALYSRLSSEDALKGNDPSNSIVNQKILLDEFVGNHSELAGSKTIHISDDGYSGTNFNRPGIQRLLDMARKRSIQCIAVKDFSRFGRNYIEVGSYLEEIFPFLGIRFISVNDGFDSKYNSAAGSLDIGFKNIMHEYYAQSTSRKVAEAKLMRAKMGMFVGGFSFFGYQKSPVDRHKLVINEAEAAVVRKIFDMRLQNYSLAEIARTLNKSGIPTPGGFKRQNGSSQHITGGDTVWQGEKVSRILADERYTGKLVYRKTTRAGTAGFGRKSVPESEWLRINEAFDPIISEDDFNTVRLMRGHKTNKNPKRQSLFRGLLKCGFCGKRLVAGNFESGNCYCARRWHVPESECAKMQISYETLKTVVFEAVGLQVQLYCDAFEKISKSVASTNLNNEEILSLQKIVDRRDSDVFELYEEYVQCKISRDEFVMRRDQITKEAERARSTLDSLQQSASNEIDGDRLNTLSLIKQCGKKFDIDNTFLKALINEIKVYAPDRIEIVWKYSVPNLDS